MPAAPDRAALLAAGLLVVVLAGIFGWVIASAPGLYRAMLALAVATLIALTALRWPNTAILAGLLFLPFLGLIRRLLISSTGWPEIDPLLLIGPAIALVLFAKAYVLESRPLAPDLTSKLVLAMLALVALSIFNPLGGGLSALGLATALLSAVPLLWFFIGRALPDTETITRIQGVTAFLAAAVALYGLWQTEVGFPSWDLAWTEVGGYTSLSVGEDTRAWGTLASATEYAGYLGAGLIFSVAALFNRRLWPWVLVPLLSVGILFSSHRFTLALVIIAIGVLLGLRSSRPQIALPVVAVVGFVAYLLAAPVLAGVADRSGSDLISHQLGGIARPFDDDASSLGIHLELMEEGFKQGLQNPVGQGVAPNESSSGGVNYAASATEFDFSDMFVRFGAPGGLLFIVLTVTALMAAGRNYGVSRDPLILGAVGAAVVTLGFWLNGAHYVLAPLVWLMLGWATRPARKAEPPAVPPAAGS